MKKLEKLFVVEKFPDPDLYIAKRAGSGSRSGSA